MKRYYCFLNGRVVDEKRAGLSLRDLGVLRGYGVFDFMRTVNGKPFLYDEHFRRLSNSCREFRLKNPFTKRQLADIIAKLIKKNGLKEVNVRVMVTGGQTPDGITLAGKPSYFVLVDKLREPAPICYKEGVRVITSEYARQWTNVKSANYIQAIKCQQERDKKKAIEIVYVDQGMVREGTTSNFFLFKGDVLVTAKERVLPGITRKTILKLARKRFKVQVRDVRVSEIRGADEAFLTATNKKVLPVVKVDNTRIGNGKVGERTKWLMEEFKRLEAK